MEPGRPGPGLGRGDDRRLGLTQTHVEPHLAIGDVAARQAAVPHRCEEPASYSAGRDRQPTRPSGAAPFIQIDALLSPCLPRRSQRLALGIGRGFVLCSQVRSIAQQKGRAMCFAISLIPGTLWLIVGYFVPFSAFRIDSGGIRAFGVNAG
jgi:hypothetical protein